MTHDATLPAALPEPHQHRAVWSVLTRWWSPAAISNETELGYESALPWTLGDEAPANTGEAP